MSLMIRYSSVNYFQYGERRRVVQKGQYSSLIPRVRVISFKAIVCSQVVTFAVPWSLFWLTSNMLTQARRITQFKNAILHLPAPTSTPRVAVSPPISFGGLPHDPNLVLMKRAESRSVYQERCQIQYPPKRRQQSGFDQHSERWLQKSCMNYSGIVKEIRTLAGTQLKNPWLCHV